MVIIGNVGILGIILFPKTAQKTRGLLQYVVVPFAINGKCHGFVI